MLSGFFNQLFSSVGQIARQSIGGASSGAAPAGQQSAGASQLSSLITQFISQLMASRGGSSSPMSPSPSYPQTAPSTGGSPSSPPKGGAYVPPQTSGASGAGSSDMDSCLASHNRYRAMGGSPQLVWDAGLASQAQQWANNLAGGFGLSLRHSYNGNGENLFGGQGGSYNCESAVTMWYNEKPLYNGGPVGGIGFSRYGHYTQLMWKSTKKVGCAAGRSGSKVIYVCQYYPAGNKRGTTLANS
jgi:pathogenesis-related protein 1